MAGRATAAATPERKPSSDLSSYDLFTGPDLDTAPWTPADFGTGPRAEPDARTTVRNGTLRRNP